MTFYVGPQTGVAIRVARRRGMGRFLNFFGRVLFVKSSRQRQPEPSATRKFFCEPIIFSWSKLTLFAPTAGGGERYLFLGRSDFTPPPGSAPPMRPTIATPEPVLSPWCVLLPPAAVDWSQMGSMYHKRPESTADGATRVDLDKRKYSVHKKILLWLTARVVADCLV